VVEKYLGKTVSFMSECIRNREGKEYDRIVSPENMSCHSLQV